MHAWMHYLLVVVAFRLFYIDFTYVVKAQVTSNQITLFNGTVGAVTAANRGSITPRIKYLYGLNVGRSSGSVRMSI